MEKKGNPSIGGGIGTVPRILGLAGGLNLDERDFLTYHTERRSWLYGPAVMASVSLQKLLVT